MRLGFWRIILIGVLGLGVLFVGVLVWLLPRIFHHREDGEIVRVETVPGWEVVDLPGGDLGDAGLERELVELLEGDFGYVTGLVIVRGSEVVFERYGEGVDVEDRVHVWSVSKSFVNALVGIAIEDGLITSVDATVGELLSAEQLAGSSRGMRRVTVGELMSMTSGVWCRWDSCTGQSFRSVITRRRDWRPGERFLYDTSSSQILSAILANVSGMTMQQYAEEKLFAPLGMGALGWDMDVDGYSYGGRGMYLRSRDMVKLGQLYLQEGVWEGERLISAEFIQTSTINQTPEGEDVRVYGYLWWLGNTGQHNSYLALGYGSQIIYVVPDLDLVVAMTTDQQSNYEEAVKLIENVIAPAIPGYEE